MVGNVVKRTATQCAIGTAFGGKEYEYICYKISSSFQQQMALLLRPFQF